MKKLLLAIVTLGLLAVAGQAGQKLPTLGCNYAAWAAYMQSTGCSGEPLGLDATGATLFNWTLHSGDTITCAFERGVAVGVMCRTNSPWTDQQETNLLVNISGTNDWSHRVLTNLDNHTASLETTDGTLSATFYPDRQQIWIGYVTYVRQWPH